MNKHSLGFSSDRSFIQHALLPPLLNYIKPDKSPFFHPEMEEHDGRSSRVHVNRTANKKAASSFYSL